MVRVDCRRRQAWWAIGAGLASRDARADAGPHIEALWAEYRLRHVRADGAVVDHGQGGIIHSEGQAVTLFLATAMNDLACFRLVHSWMRRHLMVRPDALMAWRFQFGAVTDHNNATDADLFHAWALLRAAELWPGQDFAGLARRIGQDLLPLRRRAAGLRVLLPGAWGFQSGARLDLNPSYIIPGAYRALQLLFAGSVWRDLEHDGVTLLRLATERGRRLLPDWLSIDQDTGSLGPTPGRPRRFGADALRVPMYLTWSGYGEHEAVRLARSAWMRVPPGSEPAWIDIDTGQPSSARCGAAASVAQLIRGDSYRAPGGNLYFEDMMTLLCAVVKKETQTSMF